MKQIAEFLKTTVIGGLFVLLPVLLLYMLLSEALAAGRGIGDTHRRPVSKGGVR